MIAFPNPSASNTGFQVFPADTLLVMWARRSQSLPLYISGTSSNPTAHSSAAIMPLITTSAHRHEHIGISMLVFRTCRSAQTLIEVKSIHTVAPILPDAIVMHFSIATFDAQDRKNASNISIFKPQYSCIGVLLSLSNGIEDG
jgi:hypothetical protein